MMGEMADASIDDNLKADWEGQDPRESDQYVKLILNRKEIGVSLIQRELFVGLGKARRILDLLEQDNLIRPGDKGKYIVIDDV